jgi:hypothetical protein
VDFRNFAGSLLGDFGGVRGFSLGLINNTAEMIRGNCQDT